MTISFIVSVLAIFLAYLARRESKKYALPLAFVIITVFLSLGYNWGNDVATYEIWYSQYNDLGISLFDFQSYQFFQKNNEYGWALINLLSKPIDFYGMRAVLFCFENLVIYLLIKKNVPRDYYWLAVFIYTFNPNFMLLSSSMMRQWLAMCIVALSFMLLEKRRWMLFITLILIAFSIHTSAIICLPLVVLPYFTFNIKNTSLILLILVFIVYYYLSGMVVENVVQFLQTEDLYTYTGAKYSTGVGILSIVQLLIFFFMYTNIQKLDNNKRIYMSVPLFYGLLLPLYNYSGLASRLGYYFTIFTICAYPLFIKYAKIDVAIKLAFTVAVILITLYSYFIFATDPMWLRHYGKYITLMEAGIL